MNRHAAGFILFMALTLIFVSFGMASMMWSTTNIRLGSATLTYNDPYSGKKVMRNFTGLQVNYLFEMQRDPDNHHYINVQSSNGGSFAIDGYFVGGGVTKSNGTTVLATWDDSLPACTFDFSDGISMDSQDVKALAINCTYKTDSNNAAVASARMTAAGMLTYYGQRIPARVTMQLSTKSMAAGVGDYDIINRETEVSPNNGAPPTLEDLSVNVSFGNTTTIDLFSKAVSLLTPLKANVKSKPLNGTSPTVGAYTQGKVTYSPNPGFSGKDTFTYSVSDSKLQASLTKTVTVNVGEAPKIGNYTTLVKHPVVKNYTSVAVSLPVTGLTGSVTVTANKDARHGKVFTRSNGTITYQPEKGYDGIDYFTYTLSDKTGWSTTGYFHVAIAPTAVDDTVQMSLAGAHTINASALLDNDIGGTGTKTIAGVFSSSDTADNGTVSISGTTITYTPRAPVSPATESFTYTMKDGSNQTSAATVTVIIGP